MSNSVCLTWISLILIIPVHKLNRESGNVLPCSNRAASFLALELWPEALADTERARRLAQTALKRSPKAAGPAYVKALALKGAALIGAPTLPSTLHSLPAFQPFEGGASFPCAAVAPGRS